MLLIIIGAPHPAQANDCCSIHVSSVLMTIVLYRLYQRLSSLAFSTRVKILMMTAPSIEWGNNTTSKFWRQTQFLVTRCAVRVKATANFGTQTVSPLVRSVTDKPRPFLPPLGSMAWGDNCPLSTS